MHSWFPSPPIPSIQTLPFNCISSPLSTFYALLLHLFTISPSCPCIQFGSCYRRPGTSLILQNYLRRNYFTLALHKTVRVMSSSEADEQLKRAIALSLEQTPSPAPDHERSIVDLNVSDNEDGDDLDAPVATHFKFPQVDPVPQSNTDAKTNINSHSEYNYWLWRSSFHHVDSDYACSVQPVKRHNF